MLGLTDTPGHLSDHTPLDPDMARRLACDATLTRLVTDPLTGTVVDLGRSHRHPSTAQRRRLNARDQHCRFPTCDRPAPRCRAHHIRTWTNGGTTDENNLILLCHRHHQAVHEGGWHPQLQPDHTLRWTPPPHRDGKQPPDIHLPHPAARPAPHPDPPLYRRWSPPPPPTPAPTAHPAGPPDPPPF